MRSSKSRSRSKSNRPRSIGNIVNRVFDSSGPEGKVRGTPQQIIEKYQFLARDAQLSNDRVAAENFMQHAEHYTRMLAEAQRELAVEQEQRRPQGEYGQNGGQGGGQNGNHNGGQNGQQNGNGSGGYQQGGNRDRYRDDQRPDNRQEARQDSRPDPRPDLRDEQPDLVPMPVRSAPMMDFIEEITDSGLVETPETRRNDAPAPTPRPEFNERRDRGPKTDQPRGEQRDRRNDRRNEERKPQPDAAPVEQAAAPVEAAPVAAEAAPAPRKPRAPRKPKPEPESGGSGPAEAAE